MTNKIMKNKNIIKYVRKELQWVTLEGEIVKIIPRKNKEGRQFNYALFTHTLADGNPGWLTFDNTELKFPLKEIIIIKGTIKESRYHKDGKIYPSYTLYQITRLNE